MKLGQTFFLIVRISSNLYIQNQNIQNLRASVILRMVPSSERMALPLLRAVREEWLQLGCGRNSGLNSGIIALP